MNKQVLISIILIASLLSVLPMTVSADVYVSPGDDIQAAVNNAAANGGTVYFAPGTYYVNLAIIAPTESFALLGAGAGVTILDGDDNGSVIYVEDTGDCVITLEGFTITNGTGSYCSEYYTPYCGGGMYAEYANIVVRECTFEDNYAAYYGGGLYTYGCYTVVVTDCTFQDNDAGEYGGGMDNNYSLLNMSNCSFLNNHVDSTWIAYGGGLDVYHSEAAVTGCTFDNNYAEYYGGGISNYNSNTTITDCTFQENDAGEYGGGTYNYYYDYWGYPAGDSAIYGKNHRDMEIDGLDDVNGGSYIFVSNSTFDNNYAAYYGGAMYNYYSAADIVGCTFEDNYAESYGGGMENEYSIVTVASSRFVNNSSDYAGGMENYYSDVTVTNSVFTGNCATEGYGGAAYIDYMYDNNYLTFSNCTFTGNEATYGGAMFVVDDYYPENITVTNCILWGDSNEIVCLSDRVYSPVDGTPEPFDGNLPVVTYSDVQGGYPGNGNIDANPLFVLAPSDVSLLQQSPCIDTGTDTSGPAYGEVVDDIIGILRPQRNGYDMGAYEFVSPWAPVSVQPLARTQLQSVLSLWEDLLDRLPEEPTDGMTALIAQIQEHMANAAQLTNPIYASGQLSKALALMEELATLLT